MYQHQHSDLQELRVIMNESAAKSLRGETSEPFDIEEFEQRMRGSQPRPPGHDPLVELTQLVNSAEDPFRDLFADPAAARALSSVAPPPPAPAAPPPADSFAGYPDQAPEMLRSVADQMRAPSAAVQVPAAVAEDADAYYQPDQGLAQNFQQQPVTEPVRPAAPAPVTAPEPVEAAAPQMSAEDQHFAAPALRGSMAPADPDPIDEFERSIVQLVAARNAGQMQQDYQAPVTAPAVPPPPPMPSASETPLRVPPPPFPAQTQAQDWQADAYQADPYQNHVSGDQAGFDASGAYRDDGQASARPAIPPEWLGDADAPHPAAYADGARGGRSRKPMYYMGGALAVMVLGIGATLAMRSNGPGDGKVPTITASSDSFKVKPEQKASKPVRTVSVLNAGDAKPQTAKVVSNAEQPIDLAQVPDEPKRARRIREEELSKKLNLADRNLTQPIATSAPKIQSGASGYFPEPRKVRTVMVRPDGSLIDPTASIAKQKTATPAPAKPDVRRMAPIPRAAETPPRSVERATAEPVRKKAVPRVKTASRAEPRRPVRSAALDLTPRNVRSQITSSGGGYAVQLAAPASEGAARSVASRARARFGSIFGGRTPDVQRAVVKSRTVYRVRVTGLDRGAASRLCSQVKAKGGNCYVARN